MKSLIIILIFIQVSSIFSQKIIDEKNANLTNPSTYEKVKSGVKSVGNKVSNFFVTGYEETKNLFSSKRKVGDYTINKLDVRIDQDEISNSEVNEKRTKREEKNEHSITDENIYKDRSTSDVSSTTSEYTTEI